MRKHTVQTDNKYVPASVQAQCIRAIDSIFEERANARKDKSSENYRKMLSGDAKDLSKVLTLAKQGKIAEARKFASYLDTASRENIPDDLWDILDNGGSGQGY